MFAVVNYVKKSRPMAVILENVHGMRAKTSGMDKSALEIVQDELRKAGYGLGVLDLNLSLWHDCDRRRPAPQSPFLHTCLETCQHATQPVWEKSISTSNTALRLSVCPCRAHLGMHCSSSAEQGDSEVLPLQVGWWGGGSVGF